MSFDAAGGWNIEEEGYQSVGSGSIFAKSSIKKLYSQVTDADSALRVAIEALYDAADDDSATGGPIWCAASIRRRSSSVPTVPRRCRKSGSLSWLAKSSKAVRAPTLSGQMRANIHLTRGVTLVSFPYFISPEQAMRERSELARKGIARGRSVVALVYADGVLFVAENPSRSLQKVSELYDRVGFAAVGQVQRIRQPAPRRHPIRRHPRLRL